MPRAATVLVVEDEEAVRAVVRRTLERAGYHVIAVGDGARGCAWWSGRGVPGVARALTLRRPAHFDAGRNLVASHD